VALAEGVRELASWVASQTSRSLAAQALQELESHHLLR
jgi:hypothetical protein